MKKRPSTRKHGGGRAIPLPQLASNCVRPAAPLRDFPIRRPVEVSGAIRERAFPGKSREGMIPKEMGKITNCQREQDQI